MYFTSKLVTVEGKALGPDNIITYVDRAKDEIESSADE